MMTDDQNFLEELASSSPRSFETKFSSTALRLGLHNFFSTYELKLLFRANLNAALCNISFNGLGGCKGSLSLSAN
jgi:hypothetical protein